VTNEETINQLISLMTGVELPYASAQDTSQIEESFDALFDSTFSEESHVPAIGNISQETLHSVEVSAGLGQASRPRYVTKDEYGYPIIAKSAEVAQEGAEVAEEEDLGEQI
jgi:hypothetical protein